MSNTSAATGFTFTYQGTSYTSPAAITAFRNSTKVDTGKGPSCRSTTRATSPSTTATPMFSSSTPIRISSMTICPAEMRSTPPPPTFTAYPTALGQWVIHDLDSSTQPWKIVVYHQPAFSSGDATIVNNQMRAVAKLLEDHGVNMVFNGHEHNYQRTLPIRSTARTASTPTTTAGSPAVYVDQKFDGNTDIVPDGVLYMVEGAGGNRDFDGDFAPPRGSGVGLDQDDSATGTFVDQPGLTVPQGPASWLDTNLTNPEMINFFPNAGQGTKITSKFKSKIFSFGDVLVDHNKLTLYQISEPLQSTSSATSADPAPYGTDINGRPLNDPIPDTQLDPLTGQVISAPATGRSALLDKWTITKPDVGDSVLARLSAPSKIRTGQSFTYTVSIKNGSDYSLNGTQVRLRLPEFVTFAGTPGDTFSVNGNEVVVTVGRIAAGSDQSVEIPVAFSSEAHGFSPLLASAGVSSSTALPVNTNGVLTNIVR